MFIYISPRAFFARFPAPCGFLFYRSRAGFAAVFACSSSLAGAVLSFSRVHVLTLSVRFSSLFSPLVSFALVFDVSRSCPSLLSLAVGLCVIAHRLVPVSSPVSLFRCGRAGRRRLSRGLVGYPVAWRCVRPFCLAARFLPCRGNGAFWLVFPYGIIGGRLGWAVRLRRDEHSE